MIKKLDLDFDIPKELYDEDVYALYYLCDSEEEGIIKFSEMYNSDKNIIYKELHEFDNMRKEFGKENYLRTYENKGRCLSELINGKYIIWESY